MFYGMAAESSDFAEVLLGSPSGKVKIAASVDAEVKR
jgi:hypothetical protein